MSTLSAPEQEAFVRETVEPIPADLSALANLLFVNPSSDALKRGRSVAFAAPKGGEGVTTTLQLLTQHLRRFPEKTTLTLTTEQLRMLPEAPEGREQLRKMLVHLPRTAAVKDNSTAWASDLLYRRQLMERLETLFDHVLIDCQPAFGSSDLVEIAPLVSGVVLVIAAGRTTRAQIRRTQELLEQSGGTLLGCCMNRRTYPIPAFIHRKIQNLGN